MVWHGKQRPGIPNLTWKAFVRIVFPRLPSFLHSSFPALLPCFLPSCLPSVLRSFLPHTIPIPTRTHAHIIAGARPSPSPSPSPPPTIHPAFHHGTRDFVLSWVLSLLLLLLFPRDVGRQRVAFHNTSQSPSKHTYLSPSKVSWRLPSQPLWPCVRCTDECPRMYTLP